MHYDFSYSSDTLVTVTLTAPSLTRVAKVHMTSGKVVKIEDPDGTMVQFGYLSNSKRINSRTDRLSHTTTYTYDAAAHLTGSSLSTSGGTIATTIDPAESRGALGTTHASAQPVDSVYTLLNGPRTDVSDITKFWLNPFGAPRHISSTPLAATRG